MKYLLSITTRVVTGKLSWGGGAIKCYWRTGPTLRFQFTAASCANDNLLIIIEIHQKVQYIMLSSLDSIVQIVKPHVLSIDLIFSFHFQKNFIKPMCPANGRMSTIYHLLIIKICFLQDDQ